MTDTRATVLRMVKADPRVSAASIARAAGVSRARVHELLTIMGYELRQEWKKTRGRIVRS